MRGLGTYEGHSRGWLPCTFCAPRDRGPTNSRQLEAIVRGGVEIVGDERGRGTLRSLIRTWKAAIRFPHTLFANRLRCRACRPRAGAHSSGVTISRAPSRIVSLTFPEAHAVDAKGWARAHTGPERREHRRRKMSSVHHLTGQRERGARSKQVMGARPPERRARG